MTLPALAPCKVELRLEPDEYAQALYLATAPHPPIHIQDRFDTTRVWGVREAVRASAQTVVDLYRKHVPFKP